MQPNANWKRNRARRRQERPGLCQARPLPLLHQAEDAGRQGRMGQLAPEELRTPALIILPSTFAKKAWVNAGLNIWPIVATILSRPITVAQTLMAARPKSKQRAGLRQSSLYRRYRSQPLYAWLKQLDSPERSVPRGFPTLVSLGRTGSNDPKSPRAREN